MATRYRVRQFLACTGILAVFLGAAVSAHAGDAADGKRIAAQWCASCHVTNGAGTAVDGAPTFHAVANAPDFSEAGLEAWLADPHFPMPKLQLSNQAIDHLVAYFATLRKD